ncbi:membrane protein insertase YidC [Roseitalea porphyridii]|uniref:Membrane protein insertase YidC n=1 Tax=Roseitalea porphyridii TaxID=1852022 RepID=A0A4P6UXK0_9HYPH|nr:membrane protein insertase YidC [Roseitalea porphyridii]QBK29857.1 membrane protein insertase YidC [Roseitalea porphyridii]
MDNNNRNLFLTIALSVLILTLWQIFYVNPQIEAERQAQIEQQAQIEVQAPEAAEDTAAPATSGAEGDIPQATVSGSAPEAGAAGAGAADRDTAVAAAERRVPIETPTLTGSINLTGARFDDLSLKNYHVEVDEDSPIVDLLSPVTGPDPYFAEFGYTGIDGAPGPTAEWQVDGNAVLTPDSPVTLTYSAPNGLDFTRRIAVDDNYMFSITDEIANAGTGAVALQNYGRTTRYTIPATPPIFILHEGMIGVTGEEGLTELTFGEMRDDGQVVPGKSSDGWLGITDKYWATAIVPRNTTYQPRYSFFTDGSSRYQADFLSDAVTINAGQSATVENLFFAGAKKTRIIDAYEADRDIRQFELMIDWGWFHFITKPLFHLLYWLNSVFGNFGVAILIATVLIKLVFFPLANKSYASMARMKVVQPKMQEIKERYGDDREKMQKAMMELYKKEKINPIAGCWPVLIQIPVFFALYKVLYVTIEMRHAPFFGWIRDLSAPDPTSIFNLFGLLPYDPSAVPLFGAFLMLGVWPLIMGVTMFVQMQMNPPPPDPTTAMIFKWMPVVFTFMLATFPAGLVIYWAWNNFLSIIQQGVIMKRNGAKIELWDNLRNLFGGGKADKPAE